jgi:hypothetical protein
VLVLLPLSGLFIGLARRPGQASLCYPDVIGHRRLNQRAHFLVNPPNLRIAVASTCIDSFEPPSVTFEPQRGRQAQAPRLLF